MASEYNQACPRFIDRVKSFRNRSCMVFPSRTIFIDYHHSPVVLVQLHSLRKPRTLLYFAPIAQAGQERSPRESTLPIRNIALVSGNIASRDNGDRCRIGERFRGVIATKGAAGDLGTSNA